MKSLLFFYSVILLTDFKLIQCYQTVAESPKNVSILEGEDTTLKCKIRSQAGDVIWCKDDFCAFTRKRNFADSRFSFVGDETKGEHHLSIRNVSINDNANYQCQVTASQNEKALKSDSGFLTVLVKPSSISILPNPEVKDNSTVHFKTNSITKLKCVSKNSNPPCEFSWFIDSKELKEKENGVKIIRTSHTPMSKSIYKTKLRTFYKLRSRFSSNYRPQISHKKSIKSNIGSSKLYLSTGQLEMNLTNTDFHLKDIKCECKISRLAPSSLTVSDSKTIIVNYSPIAKIWKITDIDILDGSFIQFECISDARPPVDHYKWYIGDKVLSSGVDERYLYLRIEDSMHKKELKCDTKNDVSTQTATYIIEVTYGPKFNKQLPSHKMVRINEKLSLTCDVDSHPSSSIFWDFNGTNIYTYPTLRIDPMKPENYGTYKCTASLKHFPKLSSSIKIVAPGPPVIIDTHSPQFAFRGQRGVVECTIEHEPKADIIDWYVNGRVIDFKKSFKYKGNSIQMDRVGIKTQLVINDVEVKDFTNYTCKATNRYGSRNYRILLQPKNNRVGNFLPYAIIFLCFFILCSIVIFFFFLKFTGKNNLQNRRRSSSIRRTSNAYNQLRSKPSAMIKGIDYHRKGRKLRKQSITQNAINRKRGIAQNPYLFQNVPQLNNPYSDSQFSPIFNVESYNPNQIDHKNVNFDRKNFAPTYKDEDNYETVMDTDV